MTWEQRLRELLIASGALAAAACAPGANEVSSAAENVHPFCCNASSDPCCLLDCYPDAAPSAACLEKRACEADGGTPSNFGPGITQECFPPDAAADDAAENVQPFCCNGSSDPCCLLDCYPDAAPSTACLEKRTCEADGGTWGNFSRGITQGCFPPAAAADAEPFQDAAPNDAGAGTDGHE